MKTRGDYTFTCHACGKRRYATREAAERHLTMIQATSSIERTPVRTYQCTRGWWHLTSSTDPMDTFEAVAR